MKWITDWDEIDDNKVYLLFTLNGPRNDVRLGQPIQFTKGWEVKRRLMGYYAAIVLPTFPGLSGQEIKP